jgi:hypothetical protein
VSSRHRVDPRPRLLSEHTELASPDADVTAKPCRATLGHHDEEVVLVKEGFGHEGAALAAKVGNGE